MAAAAVMLRLRRLSQSREAKRQKEDMRAFVKDVLKRYDVSKSGGLKYQELKKFLEDLLPLTPEQESREITEPEVPLIRLALHRARHTVILTLCAHGLPSKNVAAKMTVRLTFLQIKWVIQMATPQQELFVNKTWLEGRKQVRTC
jgi:hypothetical protein